MPSERIPNVPPDATGRWRPRLIAALVAALSMTQTLVAYRHAARAGAGPSPAATLVGGTLISACLGGIAWSAWRRRTGVAPAPSTRDHEGPRQTEAAAHFGRWDWDTVTGTVHWSDEVYRLFGLGVREFVPTYERFLGRVHPDDVEDVGRAVERVLTEDAPCRIDHRIVRPSGEIRWVHQRGQAIRNETGDTVRLLGTMHDITDRKQAEEALERERARLRDILDRMTVFVGVLSTDGVVVEANRPLIEATGQARDSLIGSDFPDASWWSRSAGARDRLISALADATSGQTVRYDERVRVGTGETISVDATFAPLHDQGGRVVQIICSATDVSERLEAERALRDSEERYRTLIDQAPVCILEIAPDGRIRSVNTSGLAMLDIADISEVVGTACFDYVAPAQRDRVRELFELSLDGESQYFTFSYGDGDGRRVFDSCFAPLRNASGAVDRIMGVSQDVTKTAKATDALRRSEFKQRELARQASEASAAKSEFLANMSHEIRTPMTAIIGYTDILGERLRDLDDEQAQNALATLRHSGEHLLTLINDILDLSKIEAGRMVCEQTDTDLSAIIAEVVSLLAGRAEGKGIELTAGCATPIPRVIQSDPVRLRQIILNLVGNAVKFTEIGSVRIVASADPATQRVAIEVIDTGIGMKPETTRRLFNQFVQADTSTTRRFGGSGLGLAISERLAIMLGGHITVESELGAGSRFVVAIHSGPIADVETTSRIDENGAAPKRSVQVPTGLSGRILAAEDGPDNRRLISHYLSAAGFDVEIVENGQLAVDRVLEAPEGSPPVDLIVMDMQMPVLDGYAATVRLRRGGFTRPIVALTAHAMPEDRARCLDAGCDAYESKPIDRARFIRTIAALLDAARDRAA